MRKIGILLFAFLFVLVGCAPSTDTASRDKFIVGMECGYAPYNWTQSDPSDSAVAIDGEQYCDGYDVQIAKRLAASMNKELEIKKLAWEGLILSIQTGQIDAIIAGMSPTDERKKEIAFSDAYYTEDVGFGVVVKKDGSLQNATSVHDFSGMNIAAQIGTFHVDLLGQLEGAKKMENYKDFMTMTVALEHNELDGFVADSGTGKKINATNDTLQYIQLDGPDGFAIADYMVAVSVGIAKENTELLQQVNDGIKQISGAEQKELMESAINYEFASGTTFFGSIVSILENNGSAFLRGTMITLAISITATLLGFLIALLVSIVRNTKVTGILANIYIAVFRGTPMMVQSMVIYYGTSMLIPGFRWSNLPFGNIIAGIFIVSINTGAYLSETIRSGIQAIDPGQFEAAKSLGFTRWQTMRYIILPQAIKNVIPALGNELIVNVKDTSVLNIISVTELFFVSNGVAATTLKIFETFTITSVIYLFLTMVLTMILRFVELRLDKTKTKPSHFLSSSTEHVRVS